MCVVTNHSLEQTTTGTNRARLFVSHVPKRLSGCFETNVQPNFSMTFRVEINWNTVLTAMHNPNDPKPQHLTQTTVREQEEMFFSSIEQKAVPRWHVVLVMVNKLKNSLRPSLLFPSDPSISRQRPVLLFDTGWSNVRFVWLDED